jgi:class 3 adenylate cyclase
LIEDNREVRWRNLLIEVKKFLWEEQARLQFALYKFTGDGWILFFDKPTRSGELFLFMKRLCDTYLARYKREVAPIVPKRFNTGITFGLTDGRMVKFRMNEQWEYIGRPLNLAARLQGAIGGKDDDAPQNRVLMTKGVYHDLRADIEDLYRISKVRRTLKNVAGGESLEYIKLSLYEPAKAKAQG